MSQSVNSSLVMAVGARRITRLATRCTARQLARLWMTTLVVRRAPSRPPQIALMRRCALAQAPCRTDRRPASFARHSGEIRRLPISPLASVASTSVAWGRQPGPVQVEPDQSRSNHARSGFRRPFHAMMQMPPEIRPFDGSQDMTDRWLSVEEIAEYLGVSKDTVYAWT